MKNLYLIHVEAHALAGVDAHKICWGSCGLGLVGGVGLEGGACIPCNLSADQCPAYEDEMPLPIAPVEFCGEEWQPVLRKLRGT